MPTNPPTRKMSAKDRRAAPGTNGTNDTVRRLKGALARPLRLQRRDGRLRVVLVERRRALRADETPSLEHLRSELSARLLAHRPDPAARALRELAHVHDAMGRKGWPGVAVLPAPVLVAALAQAQALASKEPSAALRDFIERLRPLQRAAEQRDARESRLQDFKVGQSLDVSESTHAEFEELERSWSGTVPSALDPPERER
jgi:hypothetical protein